MTKPYFPGENISTKANRTRLTSRSDLYSSTPTQPKEKKEMPIWVYKVLGVIIAVAIIVWAILYSPLFRIKNIQINGQISPETRSTINNLKGKNIFMIGASRAENELEAQLPGIKEIKILRGIPNSLIVNIIERKPAIIWKTNGNDYLVDKDGYLYKQTNRIDYPEVSDNQNIPVVIGQRISNNSFVSFIQNLNTQLKPQTGLEIDSVSVPETTYQIEVGTKAGGPKLKLDTTKDLGLQLRSIKYILDHHKSEATQYIDVRIPGYAYIK